MESITIAEANEDRVFLHNPAKSPIELEITKLHILNPFNILLYENLKIRRENGKVKCEGIGSWPW
jgi:hypothetical protein